LEDGEEKSKDKGPKAKRTRIFHSQDNIFERNIRQACGQSDVIAARPDEVGPAGRRFRTSGGEIFGLKAGGAFGGGADANPAVLRVHPRNPW
jgi:hypothetical protein